MPQWDLLALLARAASTEPTFRMRTGVTALGLVRAGGRVVGVRHRDADGVEAETHADLTVACDRRNSVLRADAGLPVIRHRVGFDIWWFRLPRSAGEQVGAPTRHPGRGRFAMVIPREDYFQIAYVAGKDSDRWLREYDIAAFRADVAELLPAYADLVGSIASLDEVHRLDVRLDRLRRWHTDGLLCLGDAAHAKGEFPSLRAA